MARHRRSARGQLASSIAGWLGCVAVIGGCAGWEAVRLAEARGTVPDGWGAGLATGVGGGLALAGLFVGMVLVQRRRGKPWGRGRPLLLLATTAALLLVVAAFTSATVRTTGPGRAPYVVTSGIGVAEIAYVSTCLALFTMATMAALPVALARERRRSA